MATNTNPSKITAGEAAISGLNVKWTSLASGATSANQSDPIFHPVKEQTVRLPLAETLPNLTLGTMYNSQYVVEVERWLTANKDNTNISVIARIEGTQFAYTGCAIVSHDLGVNFDKNGTDGSVRTITLVLSPTKQEPVVSN